MSLTQLVNYASKVFKVTKDKKHIIVFILRQKREDEGDGEAAEEGQRAATEGASGEWGAEKADDAASLQATGGTQSLYTHVWFEYIKSKISSLCVVAVSSLMF